jgi:hypothetical protein
MNHLEIAKLLEMSRGDVATLAATQMVGNPFFAERFHDMSADRLATDFENDVSGIIKAIRYRSPMILEDHLVWRRTTWLANRGSTGLVRQGIACIWSGATTHMPKEAQNLIHEHLASAMRVLAYPSPTVQQIAAAHDQLVDEVIVETYDAHWHWRMAYTSDGRVRAMHDVWMGVDYLIDALGSNNPHILGDYVRWMRDRVIGRGLSTTHMQHLLWLLASVGERVLPPRAAGETSRMLQTCASLLMREHETCRLLTSIQDSIASEVAAQLASYGFGGSFTQAVVDVGWYLSYINDSIATNNPALFANYVRWMQHWLADARLPDTTLRQSCALIEAALQRHLPPDAAEEACAILQDTLCVV